MYICRTAVVRLFGTVNSDITFRALEMYEKLSYDNSRTEYLGPIIFQALQ